MFAQPKSKNRHKNASKSKLTYDFTYTKSRKAARSWFEFKKEPFLFPPSREPTSISLFYEVRSVGISTQL